MFTFFFVHNIVICLSRVNLDDDDGFDKDSGVVREDKASDTSNSSEDEEATIAIHMDQRLFSRMHQIIHNFPSYQLRIKMPCL